MAKQNFLSGGFYGKLGAMVGQRWKNKRTIRTYVIPKNPNTPEQKRNRSNFAGAVQFSQMGMQMNYYCNLFENPDFTKWNYRMSVARLLKFAGMTDLNLIPLYPTDFTPPLTLTQIKLKSTSGDKHITFSVPELTAAEDRVFSMMFALYNQQSIFLGYKLYLGYYYKDNPQTLEVDVDDVGEINDKCYVRLVTNDDEDSKNDMIASARLSVMGDEKDRHTFDCHISMIEKSSAGLKITFAEHWVANPTVNNISFSLSFISDGKRKVVSFSDLVLEDNGGLCSVNVSFPTTYNQDLPAFPEGSGISNVNVRYEGETYVVTLTGGSASYSDTDLTRTLDRPLTHDMGDAVGVSLCMQFEGTVASHEVMMDYYTEGRYGDSSILNGAFAVSSDGNYLNIRAVGVDKNYPMREANSYIDVPTLEFISESVTYRKTAEKKYFSNGVTISTYLVDNSKQVDLLKHPNEEGHGYVEFSVEVNGLKLDYGDVRDAAFLTSIANINGTVVDIITSEAESGQYGDEYVLTYHAYTEEDPDMESITADSVMNYKVNLSGKVVVEYDGIYYDTGKYAPKVSGWRTF